MIGGKKKEFLLFLWVGRLMLIILEGGQDEGEEEELEGGRF